MSTVRPGFTLVEVMIAIVVLTIALVALEGGTAVLLGGLAESAREERAAELVARREGLAAVTCLSGSGTDSAGGATVVWNAASDGRVVVFTLVTSFMTRRGALVRTFRATVSCP